MIVSNTTPISNLVQLQLLGLLGTLWGQVMIPVAVQTELEQGQSLLGDWRHAAGAEAIQVVSVEPDPLTQQFLLTLHKGEAEALTLAIRQQARLFLCDDLDARNAATYHHIPVSGTLGILIKAKRENLIEMVTPYLERLRREVRFWFSDELYHQIQQLVGEG
jgi:predicted nucleic acid-binding protein